MTTTTTDPIAAGRLQVEFSGVDTPVTITTAAGDVITVTAQRDRGRIHSLVHVNGALMGSTSLPARG